MTAAPAPRQPREQPPPSYEISTDPDRLDVVRLHNWLATDAYWALGRTLERQRQAIAGSLNLGAYDSVSGTQLAYARVVTDHATFAWLCDVYVDHGARGMGLGSALVDAVCAHLAPFGVYRVLLGTADAHGVYERSGFTVLPDPEKWMIRTM